MNPLSAGDQSVASIFLFYFIAHFIASVNIYLASTGKKI